MTVATAPGARPISRRMRLRSWSRIWPITPAAAQRAMKPEQVHQGVLWNQRRQAVCLWITPR
jgi:hypothetical protein